MKTTLIILILAIFSLNTVLTVLAKKPDSTSNKKVNNSKLAKPSPKKTVIIKPKAKKEIKRVPIRKNARITKYRPTGKPMANGKMPKAGKDVAVSDRGIKLDSKLWVGYKCYNVGDYTAKWVHDSSRSHGYDLTVDIFTEESKAECLKFGYKKQKIALLAKL